VTTRPATGPERRALLDGLLAISGWARRAPGDRPVELTLVVASDVRPWRYPPVVDFLYGDWLRRDYEAGLVPGREPSPDLAILLAQARAADRPLLGPPAGELLDPVPPADVRAACLHGIPGLLADLEPDTANVVLTLARIWTTLATGEIRAKDAAADWVLDRLPEEHRAVLRRARDVYLGEADDRWDDLEAAVRSHADHVVAEIRCLPA
jgi:streptomycin 3"-adenylyltransferase